MINANKKYLKIFSKTNFLNLVKKKIEKITTVKSVNKGPEIKKSGKHNNK